MTTQGTAVTQSRTTANLEQYIGSGAMSSASALKRYAQCNCPAEYNLSSCPTNANCETCDSKHKFISCKDGYTMTSRGTCEAMSCSSYGGYDVCPAGYGVTDNFSTPAGNHCVKCSKCVAGTYSKGTGPCVACACGTYSSQAGASSCTACASGSYQTATGQTSCKTVAHADGWTISANKCSITKKSCAAGYTAGVTTCSKGAYSSGGYSGDEVCGKCTLNDTCPASYSKTACTSSQTQTGSTTTEAGSTCYKCVSKTCSDYSSSYYTTQQSGMTCSQVSSTSVGGLTCYTCSKVLTCEDVLIERGYTPVKTGCELSTALKNGKSAAVIGTIGYNSSSSDNCLGDLKVTGNSLVTIVDANKINTSCQAGKLVALRFDLEREAYNTSASQHPYLTLSVPFENLTVYGISSSTLLVNANGSFSLIDSEVPCVDGTLSVSTTYNISIQNIAPYGCMSLSGPRTVFETWCSDDTRNQYYDEANGWYTVECNIF